MEQLIQGVRRFHDEAFPPLQERFARLADGQSPRGIFITCSDSRVDPSLITQAAPGEMFVHRNAGNIVPPHGENPHSEAASLEYGLEILRVQWIVVCGHTHCGAVAGLLNPPSVESVPAVAAWIKASASQVVPEPITPDVHLAAVEANVVEQIANLKTYPVVRRAVEERGVTLHGWVYHIATGEVFHHDPETERFVPLLQA